MAQSRDRRAPQARHQRLASSGAPRISDVTIDGVSLTRIQRDEFASVIQANGGDVTKLTALLDQRSR